MQMDEMIKNENVLESTDSAIETSESIPVMGTLNTEQNDNEFSAGTIDESMLSEDEREMISQYVNEIDITNVDQIVKYGEGAQRHLSDFSNSILKQVKTMDLGDVGDALKELTVALDSTVQPEKKGIAGLFQKAKHSVNALTANYAKAEANVDKIEKDLKEHQSVLSRDISIYQQMYDLNLKYYRELTMYIIAGKKALAQAKTEQLEPLKFRAEQTQNQETVQSYRDLLDQYLRFEKRISDLELTRVISIQSAPQIRLLQNNDREMMDKIQSSISNTIPLWRNQMVLSLGIEHSKRAIEAQKIISDKTNELLRKNAETLKIASVEAARESEKPIVDIEALRQCNRELLDSIKQVIVIHQQGSANRQQVHEELIKLETELKQALLETKHS